MHFLSPLKLLDCLQSAFSVSESRCGFKKKALSQIALGQVEKRHTFLPIWAYVLISCCLELHCVLLLNATLVTWQKRGLLTDNDTW